MINSLVGAEYLPSVHIDRVVYQNNFNFQKVRITIALYDFAERTWSLNDEFTGYLRTKTSLVSNQQQIADLTSGASFFGEHSPSIISAFGEFTMNEVIIRGRKYTKFKKTLDMVTMRLEQDLSVFCTSEISLQTFKENEDLDLRYSEVEGYSSPLDSLKVLEGGEPVPDSMVFYNERNVPWSGPVHKMPTRSYMGGSEHDILPAADINLVHRTLVGKSKVEYLDDGNMVLAAESFAELNPSRLLDPGEFRMLDSTTPVYQEDYVEDHARNVSNITIVDLENIAVMESPVAEIMYKLDKVLFSKVAQQLNIKNVEINRFPLKKSSFRNRFNMLTTATDYTQPTLIAKSFNNSRKIKNKTLFKTSPRELVSANLQEVTSNPRQKFFNGKNLTKEMLLASRKIGKLEQLNLTLPQNLRAINFIDYDIKTRRQGKSKYQIKLSMEDEHLKFCKNLLQNLLSNSKKIENLHSILVAKNVFDGDKFKNSFLQEFYSQYDIVVDPETGLLEGEFNTPQLKNSYIYKSFEDLLLAERLTTAPGRKTKAASLINSLNLFSSNLETILNTLQYYNQVINNFKRVYDLSDGRGSKKSSPKARKDRSVIEKTITLKKVYERKMIKPVGMNFIATDRFDGMAQVSFDIFNKRAKKEVKKFFPGLINNNSPEVKSLPAFLRNSFSDLEQNRFKDFSPAKFFFGDQEVDTTEINPESFNADFFNTLRVVRATMGTGDEESDPLADDKDVDHFRDSRDFLGTTSKFNLTMRKTLLTNPQKVLKVRRKFKLLDNKILKEKKRKVSLKSFDITMPGNKILKSVEKDPKALPIQIKALSLLKTSMTTFDLNKIDFDPLANPQTQEVFDQNYLNIGKVKILQGFERKNGLLIMSRPIYKEIDPKNAEGLKEKNVLCKVFQRNFENLTIPNETFNIHDKVFFMNNVDRDQINAQQMSGDEPFDGIIGVDEDVQDEESPIGGLNLWDGINQGEALGLSGGQHDFNSSPTDELDTVTITPSVSTIINNSLEGGEFSNTILVQNKDNYATVGFTPLVSDTVEINETIELPVDVSNVPTPNSRGSNY
jgi:hypothetical protein